MRALLENVARRQTPITYQELTKALQILPPHSIHQVTEALERLMEEDAAADHPFIAALAISKARGGLPGPGFFDCARRLGRFAGGQDARTFHAAELNAIFACWGGSGDN
jgi:alpha-D-ribose 1-methylphosphonate 5-triphosphate synthase subunit PhnI